MTARLRVHAFAMSIDGFAAGPHQSLDDPLGRRGTELHEWVFATRTFKQMFDAAHADEGSTGTDDRFMGRGFEGIGATVMGRNMFGPMRGPWSDDGWRGWWGDEPPYHHPVFVLTHHAREPLEMAGGTTFHFVTDGLDAALRRAFEAAGGLDVRLSGGVSTVRACLRGGLVDYAHLAIAPVLLGTGERLLDDLADTATRYDVAMTPSDAVTHIELTRR